MADLAMSLQFLKGVGPARFEILQKLGLNTVEDILNYFPRDYEDRGSYKKICELIDGETVAMKAIIKSLTLQKRWQRQLLPLPHLAYMKQELTEKE